MELEINRGVVQLWKGENHGLSFQLSTKRGFGSRKMKSFEITEIVGSRLCVVFTY